MHFLTYAIISNKTEDPMDALFNLLVPYQQNNFNSCLPEYLEFFDCEEECKRKFREGTTTRIQRGDDGPLENPRDEKFMVEKPPSNDFPIPVKAYEIPSNYKQVEVPIRELYSTFEEYMAPSERDPQAGRYGYWENPNCEWDYWVLGGRWTGVFDSRYDPMQNPDNFTSCDQCTGTRVKSNGSNKCVACNGTKKICKRILPPYKGDIVPVAQLLNLKRRNSATPLAIVTHQEKWVSAPGVLWNSSADEYSSHKKEWQNYIDGIYKSHEQCLVAAIDCHF